MANKRTVDPTASEASTQIIALRVTDSQLRDLDLLCQMKNVKRSQLIRDLVHSEMEKNLER